jgi:hypothetical protein
MKIASQTGSTGLPGRIAPATRRGFLKSAAAALLVGGVGCLNSRSIFAAAPPRFTAAAASPAWFARDVEREAPWLPEAIRQLGVSAAYRRRWNSFPDDIRTILAQIAIPPWLIALVPTAAGKQNEIFKQFRFMAALAGAPPANEMALRAEQLLVFGGAAQLPTPGDRKTGASLGAEGCTAAMSRYVLAQLKLEFPRQLAGLSDELANSQSSAEMAALFERTALAGIVRVRRRRFAQLSAEDILPGSLMIAHKPGGTHVFGWTRVPQGWKWYPADKMAIGNTGLPQFGDHMILAQEYVSGDPAKFGGLPHNEHGPINSRDVVYVRGRPDLGNPRTNVYAAQGSDFILIDLL